MKKHIRVIIKREHEPYGHSILIENTLEQFQKIVGGYIETVPIDDKNVMIVNEEGKKSGPRSEFPLRLRAT